MNARPRTSLPLGSLAALLATGLWAGGVPPGAPAPDPAASSSSSSTAKKPVVPFSTRSEDEVLLVELRLRYQALSQSFPVFPVNGGYLVPLGALCHELDLGVKVDPYQARAEGFVISESRRFVLDVSKQRAELNGVVLPYVASQIEIREDDIYVDTRLVAQWLPVDIQVDSLKALMIVTPREPLPIEQAQDRFRSFSASTRRQGDRRTYLDLADPYRWAEVPMIDETLRFVYAQTGDPKFQAQSSTFAAGDFLKMTGKVYFNVTTPGSSLFRGSLGRTNPDPVLLGPLQARQFSMGDMEDPGLALVSTPTAGTGAFVTNYPVNQWMQAQKRTFRGDLPEGWQVELYQNGALVGLQAAKPDGTYEFRDVPLLYGWNDFRLSFYGPQGQRREERTHVDAEQPLAPEGEYRYLLSALHPYELQGGRGQLFGAYGFTKNTSAFGALTSVDLPGSSERYGVAGLQVNWQHFTTRLTATAQQGGGSAAEFALSTRIGGVSIQASRDELQNDFFSEVFLPSPTYIRSRTSLDLSGSLPSLERPWLSVGLGARRDEFVNGGTQDQLIPRLGFFVAGWFVSDSAIISRNDYPGGPATETAYGDLLVSRQLGPENLRGEAIYTMGGAQGRSLQSLSAYVSTLRFQPWTIQAGYLHSVKGGGDSILASATKSIGHIGVSFDASWSKQSRLTAGVTLRVNLAREPRTGAWEAQAQATALAGAASGLAFTDANNNGVMDPGEKPVQGAGFLFNGMGNAQRTNADGVAFIRNLPTDQYVKMAVSQQTFEDPFMQAPPAGWRFLPRPGHPTLLGAAVTMTSDINGTVYQANPDGTQTALGGVGIELVDADGKVAAQTRSGYDGYYDLGGLKAGAYQLRVSSRDAEVLGFMTPTPRPVTLLPTGSELDGLNWVLRPAPTVIPSPSAAAAPAMDPALPAPSAATPSVSTVRAVTMGATAPVEAIPAASASAIPAASMATPSVSAPAAIPALALAAALPLPSHTSAVSVPSAVPETTAPETPIPGSVPVAVSINDAPPVVLPQPMMALPTQHGASSPAMPEPGRVKVSAAQLREAILHQDAPTAARLSRDWLAQADLKGWAVRAQIGALPETLLSASEHLDPKDGAILLRPWALANGQCARQFFVAGFRSQAAARAFAARLRGHKDLDPPKVMPVKELVGAEPPCTFYAD